MADLLVIAGAFLFLVVLIALIWVNRRKLHSNASFTAETVMQNFQMDERRAAIQQNLVVKEDEIREDSGEKYKGDFQG